MSITDGGPAIEAVLRPVQAATPFEETVERLGSAIRLGLLAPGTRLPPERQLAEQLGISRGTLSKAIATLVQSGHITSLRGRAGGTYVSRTPPLAGPELLEEQWRETLSWRAAVELGAIALATERREPRALRRMDEAIAAMDLVAPLDYAEYRRADGRFHLAVAEAARSARLVTAMTEVQDALSRVLRNIAHPAEVRVHANEQHRRLAELVRAGDVGGAVEAMREHVRGTELILSGLAGSKDAQPADATKTDLTSE